MIYIEGGEDLEVELEAFLARFKIPENNQGLARDLRRHLIRCVLVAPAEEVPAKAPRTKK